MRFLFGFIWLVVCIKIWATSGFTVALVVFFGGAFLIGFIAQSAVNSAKEAVTQTSNGLPILTMEEGIRILKSVVYLIGHGIMDREVGLRIESDLQRCKIKNPRPLGPGDNLPPVMFLEYEYTKEALQTVLGCGLMYEGEGEVLKERAEEKLGAISDEMTTLGGDQKTASEQGAATLMKTLGSSF